MAFRVRLLEVGDHELRVVLQGVEESRRDVFVPADPLVGVREGARNDLNQVPD